MKTIITSIALAAAIAAPAFAQTTPTEPATAAKTPTMEQCKAGYKADYMKSNNWSKAAFDDACKTVTIKK